MIQTACGHSFDFLLYLQGQELKNCAGSRLEAHKVGCQWEGIHQRPATFRPKTLQLRELHVLHKEETDFP